MICVDCARSCYADAFCTTKCTVCGILITTSHMPGHRVCPPCSKTQNLCEQCGKPFDEQLSLFEEE